MNSGTESRDFESREPGGDSSPDSTWGGEIESWRPIGRGLQDFGNQKPRSYVAPSSAVVEEIEDWVEVSREKTRKTLVSWFIGLCTAWVLVGIIVFLVQGNVWFLTSFGVLAMPLSRVCDYYFYHSKYSSKSRKREVHLLRKDVRSEREQH